MTQDEEHLRLLSIFHYLMAAFVELLALVGVIYLGIGIAMLIVPEAFESDTQSAPSAGEGWAVVAGGIVGIAIVSGFAALIAMTGRFIAKRKHRMFCLIMAGIECFFQPFGTVLGIFTIIVLARNSVKELFEAKPHPQPSHDDHS